MTKHNSDSGFSIIETLLVLAVVGILGFTGWYVYHVKQTSDKNYSAAANSTVPTYNKRATAQSASNTASSSSQSASTTTVFKIPELGVKVTVPNSIKDIVYKVEPSITLGSGQETQPVVLSTQTLTSLDSDCSVNGGAPAFGTLYKTSGQYPANANVENSSGSLIKQFSTYYVGYVGPNSECGSATSTHVKANTDYMLFSAALRSTIESIQ